MLASCVPAKVFFLTLIFVESFPNRGSDSVGEGYQILYYTDYSNDKHDYIVYLLRVNHPPV